MSDMLFENTHGSCFFEQVSFGSIVATFLMNEIRCLVIILFSHMTISCQRVLRNSALHNAAGCRGGRQRQHYCEGGAKGAFRVVESREQRSQREREREREKER